MELFNILICTQSFSIIGKIGLNTLSSEISFSASFRRFSRIFSIPFHKAFLTTTESLDHRHKLFSPIDYAYVIT